MYHDPDGTRGEKPDFRRHSNPTERVYASAQPFFCVIGQGSKDIHLGEDRFRYDPAHFGRHQT
jgi:hypothetical protein